MDRNCMWNGTAEEFSAHCATIHPQNIARSGTPIDLFCLKSQMNTLIQDECNYVLYMSKITSYKTNFITISVSLQQLDQHDQPLRKYMFSLYNEQDINIGNFTSEYDRFPESVHMLNITTIYNNKWAMTYNNHLVRNCRVSFANINRMWEELVLYFECPVCFDMMYKDIYACKNGHSLCKTCHEIVVVCPLCMVPDERYKNVALSQVACKILEL